jgi:endonuclease I
MVGGIKKDLFESSTLKRLLMTFPVGKKCGTRSAMFDPVSATAKTLGTWFACLSLASAQTNPTAQTLPYTQNFGTVAFSTLPTGIASWGGLNGSTVDSLTDASSSTPSADATVTPSTSLGTAAGTFGYTINGNARLLIQTSGSAPNGVNQLALAINTIGQSTVSLQYDVESITANTRTIGVICQYRVGISGGWTNLTASNGSNPYSQSGGTTGAKTTPIIALPPAALNQSVVQIRWAFWRGDEGGNNSAFAIDNISVTSTASGNSLGLTVSPNTLRENDGLTAIATVTTATPVVSDLTVTLTPSDTTEATVISANPAIIPAGQNSVTFSLRALDDAQIDGSQSVNLSATASATSPASAILTILDDEDAFSPPPTYYNAATSLTGTALKNSLKTIITTGAVQYSYSGTYTPLRAIHADPANAANLLTIYSGTSLGKFATYFSGEDPDTTWSREHVWPVSFGLDTSDVDPGFTNADAGADYTDLFNLRPALQTINSSRGNLFFDETTGSVTVPPLAPLCSKDSNSWEPRDVEKGDIARIIFYMATRYDGTDPNTIDLEIATSPNQTSGRFANLTTLLHWHENDPVSPEERKLNQLIFSTYQMNRNPFIDRPEYVAMIWGTVLISKTTAVVAEGGATDTYTVSLSSQPSANVTINTSSLPTSQVSATPASVTFTTANWNQPQTITLSAVNDSVFENSLVATVSHSITSTDTNYASLVPSSISVTVTDDDPLIAPTSLPINYGGPWSPLPTGFLGTSVSTYTSSLGGDVGEGSAQFNASGDRLVVSFSSSPSTLSYWLDGNPASGTATEGTFLVQESVDGVNFTTLATVTNKNNVAQSFTNSLAPSTRFISFLYQTKIGGNLQFDKLSITGAASAWLAWQSSFGLSGPNAAASFDFDKDGLTNLAEYALGSSPILPDTATMTPSIEKISGKSRITAIVRTSDAALTAFVETNTDLTNPSAWTTAGVQKILPTSQTGVSPGFERMVFEINDSGATTRFFRFRFQLN